MEEEIRNRLKKADALLTGHFKLTSGMHSDNYIQCAKALVFPDDVEFFAENICRLIPPVDYIISPAIGALIIGHGAARRLSLPFIFAERDQKGAMAFRRGLQVPPGSRTVIIEDVVTTGGSVAEVVEILKGYDVEVVKVVSMVRRKDIQEIGGVAFESLIYLDFENYSPSECPLCRKGLSIEKPGSRK